jgi:hypothetical protein
MADLAERTANTLFGDTAEEAVTIYRLSARLPRPRMYSPVNSTKICNSDKTVKLRIDTNVCDQKHIVRLIKMPENKVVAEMQYAPSCVSGNTGSGSITDDFPFPEPFETGDYIFEIEVNGTISNGSNIVVVECGFFAWLWRFLAID